MTPQPTTTHRSTRGLDLPLQGAPEQQVQEGRPVSRVAIMAADGVGMRPRFQVAQGDRVLRGQPLFEDRKNPGVLYTSPGTGSVAAIHRGDRRALRSVVIALDEAGRQEEQAWTAHPGPDPGAWTARALRATMLESGLWTALRTRPFGKVPAPAARPSALFVTATDSHPLAPDLDVAMAGREADIALGLQALVVLAQGAPVFLCRRSGSALGGRGLDGVAIHHFDGPHPSGTVGLHIHTLAPVHGERVAWHLGVQDLAAIGHFLRLGGLDLQRVVALGGPGARQPRLLRSRLGACLDELLRGELRAGEQRVVAGSALHGRTASGEIFGYLGRYHQQVTVLPEDRERRFLGWLGAGAQKYSTQRLFLSWLTGRHKARFSTSSHGSRRALVPLGAFEKVFPFDLMPTFLLRSVLAGDPEKAQDLGVLELDEEDLALLSFVCPSKIDYGPALRDLLTRIEQEG